MKKYFVFIFIFWSCLLVAQQTFRTEMGEIQFDASTPLEDIYAINKKVNLILRDDGEIAVLLLVKEFEFKRKLMQEHFNENYVESDKYPKAYFTGKIDAFSLGKLTAEPQSFILNGELTLHGVTRPVETEVSISLERDTLNLMTEFITKTEDHKIKVPKILFMKVGKEVQVSVSAQLDKT